LLDIGTLFVCMTLPVSREIEHVYQFWAVCFIMQPSLSNCYVYLRTR